MDYPDYKYLDTSRARAQLVPTCIFLPLSTVLVIARLISRRMKNANYGLDDLLILIALIFFYLQSVCHLILLYGGHFGHHIYDLPDPEKSIKLALKGQAFVLFAYCITISAVRCSICILFFRIFIQPWYRFGAYVNLALNVAWFISNIVVNSVICIPFSKNWSPDTPGHCIDREAFYIARGYWGLVCDVFTWSLPVPMIWYIQLPRGQKIALGSVLALGLVAIAFSAVQIWGLYQIDEDFTWSGAEAALWSDFECGIGIVCATAPLSRPLAKWLYTKLCGYLSRWGLKHATNSKLSSGEGRGSTDQPYGRNDLPSARPQAKKMMEFDSVLENESTELEDLPSSSYKSKTYHGIVSQH